MSRFSYTTASALDLLEKLETETQPPIVDEYSLHTERERLRLMYEKGRRDIVEEQLMLARRTEDT
jgi:hypothetical protein